MYNNNNMSTAQVYNEDFKIPDRLVGLGKKKKQTTTNF